MALAAVRTLLAEREGLALPMRPARALLGRTVARAGGRATRHVGAAVAVGLARRRRHRLRMHAVADVVVGLRAHVARRRVDAVADAVVRIFLVLLTRVL